MGLFRNLFKQTFIYGLATVLPRMLSFLLVPLYTRVMAPESYGEVTLIYAGFAIFNVFMAYGMETAFFRFYSKEGRKNSVVSTALISLTASSFLIALVVLLFKDALAGLLNIQPRFFSYVVIILVLDALAIIPFAWLRAMEKPTKYAIIKIVNVAINLGLNIFLLVLLPKLAADTESGLWNKIYVPDFEINYILIAIVIASAITLLLVGNIYTRQTFVFDAQLWKKMLRYALPVMIAGVAFTINEVFDRILLAELLPQDIAKAELGKYQACYKLALFMTLFATAFRLGIEPFFFKHANSSNPQKAYGQITNYFVILGSLILLTVVVFIDYVKLIIDAAYWEALYIVPIILLAGFCLGIYHNLSVWYKVTDRTHVGAIISCIGAVLTIVINIMLIPKIGYLASALATLAAYGSMMTISYFWGKRQYPIPYNMRKIGFYLITSILFSALVFYVFNRNILIGISFWLLFLALVYKLEGRELKNIFLSNESEHH
ncbi:MAG: oligosaccharide flippase family protein [Flavobacteriaceae bacterium]|nr:oligosaccharide flippase family protein [Flavobacteriaceae bacterium]MDH3795351.1 oligosaccharide flippase family protein [Flavobacteriaceae bacterium]